MSQAAVNLRSLRIHFLWGPLYRGLAVTLGEQRQLLWLGWKTRYGKKIGW